MQIRVLYGFVDARANRSFVPGDVVELPKEKAEALAAIGAVEILAAQHPAARRETKSAKRAATKAAAAADESSTAIGHGAQASGDVATAIGSTATASAEGSTAIGDGLAD
jgi:hypothetical protein